MLYAGDERRHNNPNLAYTDADYVRGGGKETANLETLLTDFTNKTDQLKDNVTQVWVSSENAYYRLKDKTKANNLTNGWDKIQTDISHKADTTYVDTQITAAKNRTNHTGTQPASSISDFGSSVLGVINQQNTFIQLLDGTNILIDGLNKSTSNFYVNLTAQYSTLSFNNIPDGAQGTLIINITTTNRRLKAPLNALINSFDITYAPYGNLQKPATIENANINANLRYNVPAHNFTTGDVVTIRGWSGNYNSYNGDYVVTVITSDIVQVNIPYIGIEAFTYSNLSIEKLEKVLNIGTEAGKSIISWVKQGNDIYIHVGRYYTRV